MNKMCCNISVYLTILHVETPVILSIFVEPNHQAEILNQLNNT